MGLVTTVNEATFTQSAEQVYDFVSNPGNWPKAYPGSTRIEGLPAQLPLKVGDTWRETGSHGNVYSWHVAIAVRPRTFVVNTVGRIGHDRDGNGGLDGRISVQYRFLRPGANITVFQRTMTVETYREAPLPDAIFATMNPIYAEKYFAAIARALES